MRESNRHQHHSNHHPHHHDSAPFSPDEDGFDDFGSERGPRPGGRGGRGGRSRDGRGFGPGGFGPGGFGPGGFGPGRFGPGGFGPGDPEAGDPRESGSRHGHGHGHGPRHPGGPRGFGSRRRRGDVSVALLLVLADEGSRNGYQMMQSLQDRSQGGWRPSPGSVYPALAQLEDRGLISSQTVEGESGRSFEITDAGREVLAKRGDEPAPWESQDGSDDARAKLFASVRSTMQATRQLAQDGDEAQIEKATELLVELRRAIYLLLAGDES